MNSVDLGRLTPRTIPKLDNSGCALADLRRLLGDSLTKELRPDFIFVLAMYCGQLEALIGTEQLEDKYLPFVMGQLRSLPPDISELSYAHTNYIFAQKFNCNWHRMALRIYRTFKSIPTFYITEEQETILLLRNMVCNSPGERIGLVFNNDVGDKFTSHTDSIAKWCVKNKIKSLDIRFHSGFMLVYSEPTRHRSRICSRFIDKIMAMSGNFDLNLNINAQPNFRIEVMTNPVALQDTLQACARALVDEFKSSLWSESFDDRASNHTTSISISTGSFHDDPDLFARMAYDELSGVGINCTTKPGGHLIIYGHT